MTNTIQNTINNFETELESGNVELINKNGEVKLYKDQDGIEYISDGGDTYSEFADGFAEVKAQYFGENNA